MTRCKSRVKSQGSRAAGLRRQGSRLWTRDSRLSGGFTLIEVMLALAVLAMALTMLLRTASSNLAATRNAQMMSVAGELARSKLYDLEEQLLQDGFGELDQELDGDFDDEGWPKIQWEAKIVKIELPNLEAMSSFAAGGAEGGAEGEGAASNPLMGVLGMLGGGLGDPSAADATAAAGAAVVSSQFELFRTVLEEAIRKVTLTVKWKVGTVDRQLVVDLYVTNPDAVGRRAAMLGISGGSSRGGSSGTGAGTGTGTGTGEDDDDSGGRPGRIR